MAISLAAAWEQLRLVADNIRTDRCRTKLSGGHPRGTAADPNPRPHLTPLPWTASPLHPPGPGTQAASSQPFFASSAKLRRARNATEFPARTSTTSMLSRA